MDSLLHEYESKYCISKGIPPIVPLETKIKIQKEQTTGKTPIATPAKFLSPESKKILINRTLAAGVHASKIWIFPFDYNELNESRNVYVICTINPETYDENLDRPSVLENALIYALQGKKAGRIIPWMTWDAIIENDIPNHIFPRYLPDWTMD